MSDNYNMYVEKINASHVQVFSDEPCVFEDIYNYFKVKDPSHNPNSYQGRKWDGFLRLATKGGKLPIGLVSKLCTFAKTFRYDIDLDPSLSDFRTVKDGDLDEYLQHLNLSREDDGEFIECVPWEYQHFGVKMGLRLRRSVLLADTGAGKSLMQYILTRYYLDEAKLDNVDAKVLLLVPSINLVGQMSKDFGEYSQFNKWNVDAHVHKITAGVPKNSPKQVYVSTWQSLQDMPKEYFHQFTHVITDEVHGARGNKIQYIVNNCINANDRAGLTGTLYEAEMHQVQVISMFGPTVQVADTKLLQELGQASHTEVQMVNLNYKESEKKFASKLDYHGYIDFTMAHPFRNIVINLLARSLKGNTLMMFERKEHINTIYEELIKHKKHVYIFNGDVKDAERDKIKAIAESNDDVTILASYGTMAVGISVKRLHNLVLCHSSKSIVRVLQTLGRLLRRHKTKVKALIIDLVDNLKPINGEANTALVHAMKRYGFYTKKGHSVSTKVYEMDALLSDDKKKDIMAQVKRREKIKALQKV